MKSVGSKSTIQVQALHTEQLKNTQKKGVYPVLHLFSHAHIHIKGLTD